jgi:hypothetical protein
MKVDLFLVKFRLVFEVFVIVETSEDPCRPIRTRSSVLRIVSQGKKPVPGWLSASRKSPKYRNGMMWRKRYSLVNKIFVCLILFVFLPFMSNKGCFITSGRVYFVHVCSFLVLNDLGGPVMM